MTDDVQNLKDEIADLKIALSALTAYVAALPGAADTVTLDRANEVVQPLTNPEGDFVGGESVIAARDFIKVIFKAATASQAE